MAFFWITLKTRTFTIEKDKSSTWKVGNSLMIIKTYYSNLES